MGGGNINGERTLLIAAIAVVVLVAVFGIAGVALGLTARDPRLECVLFGAFVALSAVLAGGAVVRFLERDRDEDG